MAQVIVKPAITFVWALRVDFFNLVCQLHILRSSAASLARSPFVVDKTDYMEQLTG